MTSSGSRDKMPTAIAEVGKASASDEQRVLDAWIGRVLVARAGDTPDRILVGGQRAAILGYPFLLRYYWHPVAGPWGERRTLAVSLNRGPERAGAAHVWSAQRLRGTLFVQHEAVVSDVLTRAEMGALVIHLEKHAKMWLGEDRETIHGMADNDTCVGL